MQADYFPFALGVRRHSDYGCHADDAPALALLEIGGIQPEIRPVADERTLEEGIHPVIDVLAQLTHRAFADPGHPPAAFHRLRRRNLCSFRPMACTKSSTRRVDTPPTQASWITATRAFSDVLRGSRNGGK